MCKVACIFMIMLIVLSEIFWWRSSPSIRFSSDIEVLALELGMSCTKSWLSHLGFSDAKLCTYTVLEDEPSLKSILRKCKQIPLIRAFYSQIK